MALIIWSDGPPVLPNYYYKTTGLEILILMHKIALRNASCLALISFLPTFCYAEFADIFLTFYTILFECNFT